ncbi:MAG: DNA polymerase II [Aeromonadaceae bacterium]
MTRSWQVSELQGFVLTRQSLDRQREAGEGNEIQLWLATDSGPLKVCVADEPLYFYLPQCDQGRAIALLQEHGIHGWLRAHPLRTFDSHLVQACCFSTLARYHRAVELLTLHGISLYEADIRHVDRYLMERFITGGVRVSGRMRQCAGYRELIASDVLPAEVVPSFRVLSLDVECALNGELFCIGLQLSQEGHSSLERVLMVGEPQAYDEPFTIEWVADEKQLLQALERQLLALDPDLIIGWNLVNFDFRLLIQRATLHRLPMRWGRGGAKVRWREGIDERQGQVWLAGRVVLDGIATLKSATWHFESYSLEAVAQQVLGRGKQIDEVEGRAEQIAELFAHDKRALARYNLEDCRLVTAIFAHCHLLAFSRLRSQLTGLELDRYGGSVAAFSHLYLPRLHQRGYVAPNLDSIHGAPSPGGYVMDSRPGLYHHVLVLDYKSLYPSIIRTFGIDPLALVLGMDEEGPAVGVADSHHTAIPGYLGARFSRQAPILPALITQLWAERDKAKAQRDEALSRAIKILMNSFYGVLGSQGCRFFDPRLASSITLRGHWIMQETRKLIERAGYSVIYGDTDSLFVWLPEPVSEAQAGTIGLTLAHMVTENWQQRLASELGVDSCLELQFERHYHRFLMPTIRGTEVGSKKRYAGLSGEGEQEQLIFKGLETVRSDWTELAKQFQQGLYQRIFHDEDPGPFIAETLRQTRAGERDAQLVYHKRLRRRLADYEKSQPPHVKAARLADEALARQGRPPRYQHRGRISYVITTQGPEPVDWHSHPLDYEHYVQKQLRPIADGILPFIGRHFDEWADEQLSLF